jgi:hypothetical protein
MSDVIYRVRTDRRVAIALVLAALFLIAWIAWTVYVWSENGSAAGIGVLVSWPAVLLALAVVASPFVAVAWFLRSREEGEATEDGADDEEASDEPSEEGDEGSESVDEGGEDEDDSEDDADQGEDDSEDDGDQGEDDADAEADPEPAKKAKAKAKAKKQT